MRISLLILFSPRCIIFGLGTSTQPTSKPSAQPTSQPSTNLTIKPTIKPTAYPSLEPSARPSRRPTARPTPKPTAIPSIRPTKNPSAKPTKYPSAKPTRRPTRKPTARPTRRPTRKPTGRPTRRPSSIPTRTPSRYPTSLPTGSPSFQLTQLTILTLIQFDKCSILDSFAQAIWKNVTADTVLTQLQNSLNNDATSLQILIGILSQASTTNRRIQQLQQSSPLYITFNIFINLRSGTNYTQRSMESNILKAFDTLDEKTNYIFRLQQQSSAFSSINKMTITIRSSVDPPQPTMKPNRPLKKEDSTTTTIIIAASSVAGFLSFFACACLFRRRRRNAKKESSQIMTEPTREPTLIQVIPTDEDVSTLSDGHIAPGGINFFGVIDGNDHTDGSSMISSDYDYNMAYGGGAGDIQSISTAGGMKSAVVSKPLYFPKVHQGPYDVSRQSSISSKNSDPSVSMKETLTLYSDDNSFERQYNQPDDRIEVLAPAGKLGIVIDTPNGGVPMVHAIKESSVLIDQVRVGDRLIAVDGIDTTSMSAIKVSRLISTLSDNPRRVLVFLRYRTDD